MFILIFVICLILFNQPSEEENEKTNLTNKKEKTEKIKDNLENVKKIERGNYINYNNYNEDYDQDIYFTERFFHDNSDLDYDYSEENTDIYDDLF